MTPLPTVARNQNEIDALREWASTYGAAVRQRTVRQETTMAKHGTLPEFMYQRQCAILEKPVNLAFDQEPSDEDLNDCDDDEVDEPDTFDESSDEDVDVDDVPVQGEI